MQEPGHNKVLRGTRRIVSSHLPADLTWELTFVNDSWNILKPNKCVTTRIPGQNIYSVCEDT